MNNLPNTRELQCYFNCLFVSTNMTTEGSVRYNITKMIEELNTLPEYSVNIITKMIRGCLMIKGINDPCEKSYMIHVCLKGNDIKVDSLLSATVLSNVSMTD